MAVTPDTLLVANGFGNCLPERYADILDRVVGIDMQIPFSTDVEVNQAMTRDLIEHMVEKGNTGIQFLLAGTVKIKRDPNLGLAGVSYHFCFALDRHIEGASGHKAGLQRGQKRRVFLRRANGDAQAILQKRVHFTDIFYQHLLLLQALEHLGTRQAGAVNA